MTGTIEVQNVRRLSRRRLLGGAGLAGAAVLGASPLLAACGSGSSGGPGGGTGGGGAGGTSSPVTWGSWANPGEGERYKQYSKDYGTKVGAKITWQQVVGDYQSKLLTQLAGGSAPDAFYVGDSSMAPLIASGKLVDLTSYLSADAPATAKETYAGLKEWCTNTEGKTYGVPVDCNPKVFWFNKTMLSDAGVTTDPIAAQAAGTWNRDALDEMLVKIKGTGKRGMIIEGNWFDIVSLITAFGGKAFDGEKAVFDQDPKAMDTLTWLFGHFKDETIGYGGSLPKGQGVDALFYGGQLASCQYGRWILPNLKKLKNLQYDVAPMPSESGKDIASVAVYTAAMAVNAAAKDQTAALAFLGQYVSDYGQQARLSGGGNAVPSIPGLDQIVTEGNLPSNAKIFSEVAAKGYAVPLAIARAAKVSTNLGTEIDTVIKSGASAQDFATKIAAFINSKGV